MKVELQLNFYYIKIFFGEQLHLQIRRDDYVGMQSYFENETKATIEFYCKHGVVIKLEYDSLELWKAVLRELNQKL